MLPHERCVRHVSYTNVELAPLEGSSAKSGVSAAEQQNHQIV